MHKQLLASSWAVKEQVNVTISECTFIYSGAVFCHPCTPSMAFESIMNRISSQKNQNWCWHIAFCLFSPFFFSMRALGHKYTLHEGCPAFKTTSFQSALRTVKGVHNKEPERQDKNIQDESRDTTGVRHHKAKHWVFTIEFHTFHLQSELND